MRWKSLSVLAVLVVGLLVAGCGGSDDGDDSSTAAASDDVDVRHRHDGRRHATTLNGSVGPGFEISLDGTDGLSAGDYKSSSTTSRPSTTSTSPARAAWTSRPTSPRSARRRSTSRSRRASTRSSATRTRTR